jgi:hypothetical protein
MFHVVNFIEDICEEMRKMTSHDDKQIICQVMCHIIVYGSDLFTVWEVISDMSDVIAH